ncbi:PPIase cyclophilin-type domain-containing protein [Durusdinium trenchii]|uniref:PPIase cyclophilin-type domain-containing protein n=1 Tax=Durusdinium trenchii TaxID=1381693 RepID=A0ABP0MTB8_9DINO
MTDGCWVTGLLFSHYFLCCVPGKHVKKDGHRLPDCWAYGWARGTREVCCNDARISDMEEKAASFRSGSMDAPSPCVGAEWQSLRYLKESAERLFYQGEPFGDETLEQQLIEKSDQTYEACPAALLLALDSRVCRLKINSYVSGQEDSAAEAYFVRQLWNSLTWSETMGWSNVMDPMVRPSLYASAAYVQVVNALLSHPSPTCAHFEISTKDLIADAAGLSLTTSKSTGTNLKAYPDIARIALILGTQGPLVASVSECDAARAMAHLFNARRFLDIRYSLALLHLQKAEEVELRALEQFAEGNRIEMPGIWEVHERLKEGLLEQQRWRSEPTKQTFAFVAQEPGFGPLSLWDPFITPVFSASVNDGVIERLLALLGVKSQTFVEIGTQLGDQCNTRYLRSRFGFHGLMMDDNYENHEINLTTHRVTPDNVVELLQNYSTPLDFDVLSLDTDGNQWLLWMKLSTSGFRPRIVVIEYGEDLPYDQDVAVRFSNIPIHQLCLVNLGRAPALFAASLTAMRNLGRALGYVLVHLAAVDLTFVRSDLLASSNLRFPAQDDPAGLCALARYQAPGRQLGCSKTWPKEPPSKELLTTAKAALAGDYRLENAHWPIEQILHTFCE